MNNLVFHHQQTAHCESGTAAALLRHAGLDLSEPMVFGLSGALTFAYLPLLKVGGMPLMAYRLPPGRVIRGLTSRLNIDMAYERFRHPEQGMAALNTHLDEGRPVGLQTSVFWLPYFPEDMRFHFNAHNLVVYGRDDDRYLISDPTFEQPVEADYESLQHARFVKGMLAPKGLLYYPKNIPANPDLRGAITKAIRGNVNMMLRTPLPIIGVRGIRFVARRIRQLGNDKDQAFGKLFIGHMVRMQEEIGTGGAGFRFLYASFLQESATILNNSALADVSLLFTDIGDEWRRFALYAAKMLKGRMPLDYGKLADQLLVVADQEEQGYRKLSEAISG
ncbi:BtrH N-terminal domain-containing protein [Aestuariicella sp. G3-2]|uniref:BtrH N-terminal domain-containing protein n=1 Tax=Pseudomaricurvus albidus TaxID=2842452 RepID=UPI001C0C3094|nr:BtrH N-terminal domain-containing protein [Aestuariicella albida]MBU3068481.1 BtrH N-terminal domain-containing protein [Aestuariicella albida]